MKLKHILCILLAICLSCSLIGCSKNPPNPFLEHPNPESDFQLLDVMIGDAMLDEWIGNQSYANVSWDNLKLSLEHSKQYSALSKTFDQYNETSRTQAKATMYEITSLAKEMTDDTNCHAKADLYLQRADNRVVSLLEGVEKYTGGIHPDYFWNGINYHSETGEKLALTDVFRDIEALPAILEKKITEKYQYVTFYHLLDTFRHYQPEEFTWTIDYQGITFWFSPYEIAAYAVGTLSVKLWFDEFEDLISEEYRQTTEHYVMSLPVGLDVEVDFLEDDGKKDSICAEKVADQYGSYYMLSVTKNQKTEIDEINYAYDYDVYFAHRGTKNFLYSDSLSDSDFHLFCTWDLNGDTPNMTHNLSDTAIDYEYVEENGGGIVYRRVINQPESLKLATTFDLLGTRGAVANYQLNPNTGIPEMTDSFYTFTFGFDVKNKIPLTAELLPDNKTIELPVGSMLTPYQTDGTTYVDCKTENGEIVRLSVDASDWPIMVNGMTEEECFEELLYAG